MSQTIVGVFDQSSDAQQVVQELQTQGIDRSNIRIANQSDSTTTATTASSSSGAHQGFWEGLKDAFGFGDDNDDRYGYREATRRGHTVVSVEADDQQDADQIASIMQRHNVINLDDRAQQWGNEGWSGYENYQRYQSADFQPSSTAATATPTASDQISQQPMKSPATSTTGPASAQHVNQGAQAIPVIQEELQVGKRMVNRGGVRVVSRVTETPVEEQVNLREERVSVERRPVDRPLTSADANAAFTERTIEATATAEEAVVAKNARVVEEVVVNKEAGERTETVRDTVRRTDVDVQQMDESDARFRPAYTFADEVSADTRYKGRNFDDVETDLRQNFEQRNPNSKWDDVRDAVRSRYNRSGSKA